MNPAVALVGNDLVMIARIAERPIERRPGQTALPRWSNRGILEVDWIDDSDCVPVDARVIALKSGALRLTSVSHLQVLHQPNGGDKRWRCVASVVPENETEEFGIEDARITKIGDIYWITYVAVSKLGACTALMSSADLKGFRRHGLIFPCENKDVVLFPETIDGDFVALHRPNPSSHFSPPAIWLARSPDLIHWGRHQPVLHGSEQWEGDRVGSGTPPILVDYKNGEAGWLMLYHGSESSQVVGQVGRYAAGAVILGRSDPSQIVARSTCPIMTPTTEFELHGFVPNVVFPTAILDRGDILQVFYGAADTCIGVADFSKRSMLEFMTPHINN